MTSITVSPKFQVVIPQHVRDRMKLKAGQKLAVFHTNHSIRLVPIVPMAEARGMFKGLVHNFEREKIDRDPRG